MWRPKLLSALVVMALTLGLAACGKKTEFKKVTVSQQAVAGEYTRPKIDILFVQDTSASMAVPLDSIKAQLNSFMDGIDSRWDFHFTVVPLQSTFPLTSKYIIAQDCSTINSSYCLSLAQKSIFQSDASGYAGWHAISGSPGNTDQGFTYIQNNLSQSSMVTTNFLRADAALAVVVISNGEDVSGLSYPADYMNRGDGQMVPNPASAGAINSFNNFKNYLTSLKISPSLVKLYSVVAANNYSNCYGGGAWQGLRYMNAANDLGGAWYDLCGGGIGSVLANIKYQLESAIQAYIFNYVVIPVPNNPIASSIRVWKNGVEIPQSSTNGWVYEGYKVNSPTAIAPAVSNYKTGYFIRMNGTAQYSGTDIIHLEYQNN